MNDNGFAADLVNDTGKITCICLFDLFWKLIIILNLFWLFSERTETLWISKRYRSLLGKVEMAAWAFCSCRKLNGLDLMAAMVVMVVTLYLKVRFFIFLVINRKKYSFFLFSLSKLNEWSDQNLVIDLRIILILIQMFFMLKLQGWIGQNIAGRCNMNLQMSWLTGKTQDVPYFVNLWQVWDEARYVQDK